jgi:hypothetical protein
MKLQLDRFSHEALDDAAHLHETSPEVVLQAAAAHYLDQRDSGRTAWPVPRFARDDHDSSLDVTLEGELLDALEAEAGRQGVTPERLAEHALLLYLGDVDRGSVSGPGEPSRS